jgi:hypothetical protein
VNDFIESEKDGVLVPEGRRKNMGFAFARFLMDRAGGRCGSWWRQKLEPFIAGALQDLPFWSD